MTLVHLGQILNYGSAYGILSLIRELKKDYLNQHMILANERSWLRHSDRNLQKLFDLGVRVRMVESTFFREPWNLDSLRAALSSLHRRHSPSLFLTHGGFSALACKSEGIPFQHICHGFGMNRPVWMDEQDRNGIAGAHKVVAVSRDIRSQLLKIGIDEQKIEVAYYPLRPQSKLAPKKGPIREIAMIGNLVPLKGQKLGIETFHALHLKNPNLRLHVYGDGPLRNSLEQKVRQAQLSGKIFFHGFCAMEKEYPKLDMILVPSLVEGLGMVNLEAFEHSLPVCAFASGGIPELVKHKVSGFLAHPGDVEGLGQCIEEVIGDPDRARRMALVGFRDAVELFDPRRNCKVIKLGFEEMLGHDENVEIRL